MMDANAIQSVKNIVNTICRKFCEKSFTDLLPLFSEQAVWTGIPTDQPVTGKDALYQFFLDMEARSSGFALTFQQADIDVRPVPPGFCLALVTYTVLYKYDNGNTGLLPFSGTFLFDCRIRPEVLQINITRTDNSDHYEKAAQNIHALYHNIPGGIFKCLNDENLTLLEMSNGFLHMIGYTREEIRTEFQNSLKKLIYPEDFGPTMDTVKKQLEKSSTKELRYRMICKDGHLITVLDKGTYIIDEYGVPSFYCVLIDITREEQIEKELRYVLERYQIILEQTNDAIFEWDLENNTFLLTGNGQKKFGLHSQENSHEFLDFLLDREKTPFYPDDLEFFKECIQKIHQGNSYVHKKLRIKDRDGRYIWCRMRMTQQFDQNQRPLRIIGIITDIDKDVLNSQMLKRRAEQDSLTGLYNKITAQSMIRSYLQQNAGKNMGALMMIDIDNFKQINDVLGHLCGDTVLSNFARAVQTSFRSTDIIGRIGGDEFIVFLKSVGSVQNARLNAQKILRIFSHLLQAGGSSTVISGSIGIAMYPDDGTDFTTLFQKADTALYRAKQHGKNCCMFYQEGSYSAIDTLPDKPSFKSSLVGLSLEKDSAGAGGLLDRIFHLMHGSTNISQTAPAVLEYIGTYFQAERVYIYRMDFQTRSLACLFEWHHPELKPLPEKRRHLPSESELDQGYDSCFDENNIFYCVDLSTLPTFCQDFYTPCESVRLLQYAIRKNGVFRGLIGYELAETDFSFSGPHLDLLLFLSHLVSLFLLEQKEFNPEGIPQENEIE